MISKFVILLPLIIYILPYHLIHLLIGSVQVSWSKCWDSNDNCTHNIPIQTSPISFSEERIQDLKSRLKNRRKPSNTFSPNAKGVTVDIGYGVSEEFLEKVMHHWEVDFDWHKTEDILNKWSPKVATISGLDIHFFHIKAQIHEKSSAPMMMIHGWPGSVWEFHKVVEIFKNPGKNDYAFDIILPSIPGYGFSQIPPTPGMDVCQAGVLFLKLMNELYPKEPFICQAGDWGSIICQCMAEIKPNALKGMHLNFFPFLTTPLWSQIVLPHWQKSTLKALTIFPYFFQQSFASNTVGFSLRNSPVSLGAWILEKMSVWSDPSSNVTLDDYASNLMIYWLTDTIASSVRFYKENLLGGKGTGGNMISVLWTRIDIPTGLSDFPFEMNNAPVHPWILGSKFTNIVYSSQINKGGHFAALEQPLLFHNEIQKFLKALNEAV